MVGGMTPGESFVIDYSKPYLLDSADKVRWAMEVTGEKWRLGDHCWARPVEDAAK